MAALLELDGVTQRYPRGARGRHERVALRDLSLALGAGELVGVWGTRHSGRSTLTLLAAGIVRPSEGAVRFDGVDLARRPMLGLRGGIGWCDRAFDPVMAATVVEHVAAPLLSGDVSNRAAERTAIDRLERVGAAGLAELEPDELDAAETTRVAIARAIVTRPRLLVVDEPTTGVRATQERPLLSVLHALAREEGVAVLMTADDAAALAGVDRALSLSGGLLRGAADGPAGDPSAGAPEPADGRVVPLRAREAR
ncbi:ATP-binding cassette domain-containing protein [Conexibacter arvalis]|uniref:Putative ABC transport system ATP-binding protein n=1 Tax=Conexibacter arvalis TaxID=912552 RepID=A0A840IJ66_9ACTN|nr:ATP-binding cassette domain-containing protein [Conexibacter arvalis]MBB4664223.1 putative ABC transport system ATP-binding protein [Conexibacter arvalis]